MAFLLLEKRSVTACGHSVMGARCLCANRVMDSYGNGGDGTIGIGVRR